LRRIAEKDGELTRLRWRLSELEQRYGAGGNIPLRAGPKLPYEKDNLKRIQGIGVVAADILTRMNITTFRQIAQWTENDVMRVSELLGERPERIRREDWIGHAKEQHLLKYGERI
jgi:predicted flap endonuclease-1-like 5' DNA nuclease